MTTSVYDLCVNKTQKGGLQQNGHKSTYKFLEKKYFKTSITIYSFQELYLRLRNPKKTSVYASGEKVMGVQMYIGVWKNVRDNQLFSHFTMKNDGNYLIYVLSSLEGT